MYLFIAWGRVEMGGRVLQCAHGSQNTTLKEVVLGTELGLSGLLVRTWLAEPFHQPNLYISNFGERCQQWTSGRRNLQISSCSDCKSSVEDILENIQLGRTRPQSIYNSDNEFKGQRSEFLLKYIKEYTRMPRTQLNLWAVAPHRLTQVNLGFGKTWQ